MYEEKLKEMNKMHEEKLKKDKHEKESRLSFIISGGNGGGMR